MTVSRHTRSLGGRKAGAGSATLWYVVVAQTAARGFLDWLHGRYGPEGRRDGSPIRFLVLTSRPPLGSGDSPGLDGQKPDAASRDAPERRFHLWVLVWTEDGQVADEGIAWDDLDKSIAEHVELVQSDFCLLSASNLTTLSVLPDAAHPARALMFGTYSLFPDTRELRSGSELVHLRPKEFDLLYALARRQGAVVTRKALLSDAWNYRSDVRTRTLEAHIALLREKLEVDSRHPRLILTVRSVGYRIVGARWVQAE